MEVTCNQAQSFDVVCYDMCMLEGTTSFDLNWRSVWKTSSLAQFNNCNSCRTGLHTICLSAPRWQESPSWSLPLLLACESLGLHSLTSMRLCPRVIRPPLLTVKTSAFIINSKLSCPRANRCRNAQTVCMMLGRQPASSGGVHVMFSICLLPCLQLTLQTARLACMS